MGVLGHKWRQAQKYVEGTTATLFPLFPFDFSVPGTKASLGVSLVYYVNICRKIWEYVLVAKNML